MKRVIAYMEKDAGLCNRIKCIINAMEVAKSIRGKLLICWKPSFSCGCEFRDLFDMKVDLIKKEDIEDDDLIVNTWNLPHGLDFKFKDIDYYLKMVVIKSIDRLKIKKEIMNKAESFFEEKFYYYRNLIGIHARRNEFLLNKDKKTATNDLFFEKIDNIIKVNSEARFFLASDSHDTKFNFLERYGGDLIIYTPKSLDRGKSETIQEALVELLLLSKCGKILGTNGSTYSEMAYWLGGATADVEMVGERSVGAVGKTSLLSWVNQTLRRNSKCYRWIMRKMGWWA